MDRRNFIKAAGALAISGCKTPFCGESGFKLAMAGYTLKRFTVDEALAFCRDHGVKYMCVKNFHLPFDSTQAQMRVFRAKCEDHGVIPYGVGPIGMYTPADARRYFDYAAMLGVDLVVGVPGEISPGSKRPRSSRKMCEHVSALAAEYDIRFAIHNHGRNPKTGNPDLYPSVPDTWPLIKDLDRRLGFCVDWAYTYADGIDCSDVAFRYADRIFDGHIRCLSDVGNGSSGINPEKRVFDYDGIFLALEKSGYRGCLGLELANAFPDHPEWIAQSYDYFNGIIRKIR